MNSKSVINKIRNACAKGIVKSIKSVVESMPEYSGVDVNDVESVKSVKGVYSTNVSIGVNGYNKIMTFNCEFHLKEKKGRNTYKGLYQYDVILDKVSVVGDDRDDDAE